MIACSGGADSVSLFHVLNEIKIKWELNLIIGHFNHKLRQQADEDQNFVEHIASSYSVPFYSESEDVRAYAQKNRMNLEEAGRRLRYGFLKKIAKEHGSDNIAMGHTMDDQAETVLMRIFRGTGSHGLGGMKPKSDGGIVRPLILAKRADVLEYIKEKGLKYRVDKSNFDLNFLRNKIRRRIIPELKNNYSSHIVDHLSRLASLVQEEDLFFQEISKKKFALAEVLVKGQNRLDMDFLHTLHKALQRRIIREYLKRLRGDLRGVSYQDVCTTIDLKRGKEFHLEKGLILINQNGLLGIKGESQEIGYEYKWGGEISLIIEEINMKVKGTRIDKSSFSRAFDNRKKAFLDKSRIKFPLVVRNRRPGDRYRPLNSPGSQKLKELMRAKRIPLSSRNKQPVFLSEDEIVWVRGLPVSEKYKVKVSTKDIFKIEILLP